MAIHITSLESLTLPPKLKSTSLVTNKFIGVTFIKFLFPGTLPN